MPRILSPDWHPKYGRHRDQARVRIPSKGVVWLPGKYRSPESLRAFDREVAEWIAAGRPGLKGRGDPGAGAQAEPVAAPGDGYSSPAPVTVIELCDAFITFALDRFRPEPGGNTGVIWRVKRSVKYLADLYGDVPVSAFGPRSLEAIQRRMVGNGLARSTVNQWSGVIKRIFKWGVARELVPVSVWQSLLAVPGLRAGQDQVRETEPVRPVSDACIRAVLPHLPRVVADMVRVQRLTGARPGEVCAMTAAELDMSGKVWVYSPRRHKNAHRGKARVVAIGPQAQKIIRPYLTRALTAPLFSPAESVASIKARLAAERTAPMTPSRQRRDRRRARNPRREFNARYSVNAFAKAIARACEESFPHPMRREWESLAHFNSRISNHQSSRAPRGAQKLPPVTEEERAAVIQWNREHRWHPNQLRHARATEIRKAHGLDAAAATLGHHRLETTLIYAERNLELAARVALKTG